MNKIEKLKICKNFAINKHEGLCLELEYKERREILEQKLNIPFAPSSFVYKNLKFRWDGYNKEHKIAFEYNGYQHYEYPNLFHKTENDFIMQIERDSLKAEYAIKNKIKLIIIPYTKSKNLKEYIYKLLDKLAI